MKPLFLLLIAVPLAAQQPDTGWKRDLDSMIEVGVREQHVPGLAVGIVRHAELVYARGFGLAKIEPPARRVTPATLFHMASVTKPFVATAIMQLVAAGRVALDSPVVVYLPQLRFDDPRGRAITVRELLSHTAGLPDVQDYQWDSPQNDDGALDRYVRSLSGVKLLWDPGMRYAYSNIGFEILGDVVARVSGVSFEDYVASHILAPLGMSTSTLLRTRADSALVAEGYTRPRDEPDAPLRRVTYPYNRMHGPSSDLFSSVIDMTRWARANMNRGELDGARILDRAAYDELWRPAAKVEFCRPPGHTDCRPTDVSVGLSWFLERKDGRLVVSHGGGDDGFITQLLMIPDDGFAFVMMTNSDVAGIPLLRAIQAKALTLASP